MQSTATYRKEVVVFVIWFLALFLSIWAAFHLWSLINDEVLHSLTARFESVPPEGERYWYLRELAKNWWGFLFFVGPFAGVAIYLLYHGLKRWVMRSRKAKVPIL